jgi:hypothetical protein
VGGLVRGWDGREGARRWHSGGGGGGERRRWHSGDPRRRRAVGEHPSEVENRFQGSIWAVGGRKRVIGGGYGGAAAIADGGAVPGR